MADEVWIRLDAHAAWPQVRELVYAMVRSRTATIDCGTWIDPIHVRFDRLCDEKAFVELLTEAGFNYERVRR